MLDLAGKTADQRKILCNRLARAYQTRADQIRICDEIGIDSICVDLSGSPADAWRSIYAEAARKKKVHELEAIPTQDIKRCQVCDGVLADGGARRPVLETEQDVTDAIAWLWSASASDRMVRRAIVWMVSDCCEAAKSMEMLDLLLRLAPVDQSSATQLASLTMTTHSLAEHLPSRATFLARAKHRLLSIGRDDLVRSLSALRDAKDSE